MCVRRRRPQIGVRYSTGYPVHVRMSATTDRGEPAGVWPRLLAYFVDFTFVGGGVFSIVNRSERSVPVRALAVGLLGTVGGLLYHLLLEGSFGRTVGKAVVGVAVVGEDGSRCTYRAAAVRTALRFVDWFPVAYLVGILSIRLTERRQRVGDVAANTVVVRTRER